MTLYMLDTSIMSDLIKAPHGKAARQIARVGERNVCASIVAAAELRYGCAKSGSKRLPRTVEDLLSEISVLPFDAPADAEYGAIRAALDSAGRPIGGNDLLIAAHARATGADDRDSEHERIQTCARLERGELAGVNEAASSQTGSREGPI